MTLLDLQGMESEKVMAAQRSGASKGCFNGGTGGHGGHVSTLSVAIC